MKSFIASIAALILLPMTLNASRGDREPGNQSRNPMLSFGIITDVHYCNCDPEGTRFYRMSAAKLREALNSLKADSVKFVINLGDLIDRDYTSFKTVLGIIDSSGLKTYHLTGNHDYSVDDKLKKHLPLPQPAKEGYYSFVYNNFRFIALNGNELSTYASANKANIKQAEKYITLLKDSSSMNANDWNGGMSGKQIEWMKTQLDEASSKNEKVFIFCHFPIYPESPYNLLNYKDVLKVLGNYHNIIACFSGHNHMGGYGNFNMIHFVTLKGMVETEDTGSSALVDIYWNKIWITGSGREKSMILAY